MNPNRNNLPLWVVESSCVLGKVHQLIWQWPIAGELEVGDSNQLLLTKISCPGGGDPYWFTAHDIPDDDKWRVGCWGGSHSMPSIKKHLADLQKPDVSCTRVSVQVPPFLLCCWWLTRPKDLVEKQKWRLSWEASVSSLSWHAGSGLWNRDPGIQDLSCWSGWKLSLACWEGLCFTVVVIHSCCFVYFFISMNLLHVVFKKL